MLNYEAHLRLYLVPVLGKRRLDQIKPTDITAIKSSLSAKSHNTMCEVLKTLRRVFNVAITLVRDGLDELAIAAEAGVTDHVLDLAADDENFLGCLVLRGHCCVFRCGSRLRR